MLIDELARRQGARVDRLQHNAAVGRAQLEGAWALLAKPLTFMNASGESVGKLARYYKACLGFSFGRGDLFITTLFPRMANKRFQVIGLKVPLERVLVVYDDLDLENGAVRLRAKGGHGGHNGMRSISQHFSGSKDFPRLRIGDAPICPSLSSVPCGRALLMSTAAQALAGRRAAGRSSGTCCRCCSCFFSACLRGMQR